MTRKTKTKTKAPRKKTKGVLGFKPPGSKPSLSSPLPKTKRKKTTAQKPMHSVSTLKKLESARARLGEQSGTPGRSSSIKEWICLNETGKAAIEQWLDACLEGNSDWSVRRMLLDLIEHFDYPFSPKSGSAFAERLRAIYGERYDLAIEMTAKTRSERS